MSSISGSDSEDTDSGSDRCSHGVEDPASGGTESPVKMEEPLSRLSPRVVFQNAQGKYLSVYRCVLQNKKMEEVEDLVPTLLSFSNKSVWVVLMTGGGHFAGAVFRKEVLQHKTFHRYTVRAKRGTAQGLRDSQSRGNAPKSAGATLRRYNEAMLVKDVQDLLETSSSGRAAPLDKNDPRVRTLPFATRRATFREVVRVHATLSTLHIYGKDTDVSSIFCPSKKAWRKKPSRPEGAADTSPAPVTAPPVAAEEEEPQEDGSTDEGDVELVEVEVTLDTLELREFEVHPSRRRRRKKKEGHRGAEVPIEPEEPREGADQNGRGTRTRRRGARSGGPGGPKRRSARRKTRARTAGSTACWTPSTPPARRGSWTPCAASCSRRAARTRRGATTKARGVGLPPPS
ncbi:hypothetical protein ANANG_G00063100 [Anguilla anguilla]|uniref:VLRF1 domain-containing protein n=1 Tax=Anguilla anguilla TaxID=7936 RepID=A0A9D3MRB4_ANGAN|nr:hypothetical protein ANANG_G00063100 [Anguilla anguilla]